MTSDRPEVITFYGHPPISAPFREGDTGELTTRPRGCTEIKSDLSGGDGTTKCKRTRRREPGGGDPTSLWRRRGVERWDGYQYRRTTTIRDPTEKKKTHGLKSSRHIEGRRKMKFMSLSKERDKPKTHYFTGNILRTVKTSLTNNYPFRHTHTFRHYRYTTKIRVRDDHTDHGGHLMWRTGVKRSFTYLYNEA